MKKHFATLVLKGEFWRGKSSIYGAGLLAAPKGSVDCG